MTSTQSRQAESKQTCTDLRPDFKIGQMCDDLVGIIIDMTKPGKCSSFPKILRNNYVDSMIETALAIQKDAYVANEMRNSEKRTDIQVELIGLCVYLNHLLRIAYDKKWISDKQRDRSQRLTTSIKFAATKWAKANKG